MKEKNVPKLRFKGFSDEWGECKLGRITKLTDGIHFTPEYVEDGIPFWSVETIVSGANPKFITKEVHDLAIKRCHPEKNDILITRIGTLAKSIVIRDDSELSIYVSVALVKGSNKFNSEYVNQYFNSEIYYREFLSKSLLTATPKKINMEDLKDTKIKLPSLKEQEKIANFLTKVDKIIEKQEEKVSNLEKYKKGMMQKIFSQEIRFKKADGEEYPEWKEGIIGNLCTVNTGKKDTQDKVDDGKYPFFVRSQNIESINSYSYDGEAILTAGDGVGVGKVFHYVNCRFDYHQRVYKLSDFNGVNGRFLFEYFSKNFKREVAKYNAKTSVDSVRLEMITKMKMPLPSLEEQDKIANLLFKIDLIVEKEKEKFEEMRNWKKGLLQQMFV